MANSKRSVKFNREALVTLRKFTGKGVTAFGKSIKRSGTAVLDWERGDSSPTVEDVAKICTEYDVDPASLFTVTVKAPAADKQPVGASAQ